MRRTPPAGDGRVTYLVLLARAREVPVRASILEILSIDGWRTLSPQEMAFELQTSVRSIDYHVRLLEVLGLIEVGGEMLTGSTYERRFGLVSQMTTDLPAPPE